MLILSRKTGEQIRITFPAYGPGEVTIEVMDVRYGKVRLGFDAPPEVKIVRVGGNGREPVGLSDAQRQALMGGLL